MESNNTTPKEILENIISVMEKTRVDDWETDKLVVVLNYINELETRIDKAIEYITNGSDFKSIYFKKTDEELWKVLLEDNIKNNLLDILRGEDNE